MHCPNCGAEVTDQSLIHRKQDAVGKPVGRREQLVCPHCQAELAYSDLSMLLGAGTAAIALALAVMLMSPGMPGWGSHGDGILGVGVAAYLGSVYYQHRHCRLVLRRRG